MMLAFTKFIITLGCTSCLIFLVHSQQPGVVPLNEDHGLDDHEVTQNYDIANEKFLRQLLQARQNRLELYKVNNKIPLYVKLYRIIDGLLSRDEKEIDIPEDIYWNEIQLIRETLADQPLEYRKEGYQLIRDFFMEIWSENDLRNFYYNSLYHIHKDDHSSVPKDILKYMKGLESSFDMVEDTEKYPGITNRLKNIIKTIIKLISNAKEVKYLETENVCEGLYGVSNRELYEQWRKLANYVLVCDCPEKITIFDEDEDSQAIILIQDRAMRLAEFPESFLQTSLPFRLAIEKLEFRISEVRDTEFTIDRNKSNTIFPEIFDILVPNGTFSLMKEGYELARDMSIEMKRLSPEKTSSLAQDIEMLRWDEKFRREKLAQSMESNIFRAINILSMALNLSYIVDEHEIVPNKLRVGQFICRSEKPESTSLRRLKHIMNAIVKLHFKVLKYQGIEPLENIQDERVVSCRFESIVKYVHKNNQTIVLHEREARMANLNLTGKPSIYPLIIELSQLAMNSTANTITLPPERMSSLPVFELAHLYLANKSTNEEVRANRAEGYQLIRDLLIEQWSVSMELSFFRHMYRYHTHESNSCGDQTQCPRILLRVLQLIASTFKIIYVDEYGHEILIDETLVGNFVHVPTQCKEPATTKKVRHILNALVDVISTVQRNQ